MSDDEVLVSKRELENLRRAVIDVRNHLGGAYYAGRKVRAADKIDNLNARIKQLRDRPAHAKVNP